MSRKEQTKVSSLSFKVEGQAIMSAVELQDMTIHTIERRALVEQMVGEFDMPVARAIIRSLSDHTGMTCDKIADIVIGAWKRTKQPMMQDIEQDELCFEKIVMYP